MTETNASLQGGPAPGGEGAAPASPVARAVEWLWRGEALARARARVTSLSAVQRVRLARARAAAALAERVLLDGELGPSVDEALAEASARQLALTLYREAAFWALVAQGEEALPADLAQAFERAPRTLLRDAAGGEEGLAAVRAALVERGFVQSAELGEEAQEQDVRRARSFVDALVRGLEVRERLIPHLLVERWSRVGMVLVALVALYLGGAWLAQRLHPDLAERARWTASSAAFGFATTGTGFHPPEGGPNIFFHTGEEASPWVEFDLGSAQPVGFVALRNRMDCCQERAVPLVVELSSDRRSWREVARRTDAFYDWEASFPRTPARYVRVRVLRPTAFHLGAVSIR